MLITEVIIQKVRGILGIIVWDVNASVEKFFMLELFRGKLFACSLDDHYVIFDQN